MHALLPLLIIAAPALASPPGVELDLDIEDGHGKLLVDLQSTASPCTSDHEAAYIFVAHGSPYRLDLTCQDEMVDLQLEEYQYAGPSLTGIQVTNKRLTELPTRFVHGPQRQSPPRKQVVVVVREVQRPNTD